MALDRIDRFRDRFRRRQITKTPAGHRVGLAETVHRDREIVSFLGKRRDTHVLRIVVNEFLVNFVRQNVNVFLGRNIDNRLQFLPRVNRAGRIAWAVQDQHLRARRHRVFKIFRAHFPGVALHRGHDHRVRARQFHHVGITDPIRRRDDDFVPRLTHCQHGVVTCVLRPVAHHHLSGAISKLVVGRQFFGNRLTQLRNAGARRIFCEAGFQRRDRCCFDVLGRVEIRFARAEPANVDSFGFHRFGFAVDR